MMSPATTYEDNKNDELSIEYFQKQLESNKNDPKKCCVMLFNFAEVLELAGSSEESIEEILEKAKKTAKKIGNFKLEAKAIQSLIILKQKHNKFKEAAKLKKELSVNQFLNSDDESGDEDNSLLHTCNDINISDISDLCSSTNDEDIQTEPGLLDNNMKTPLDVFHCWLRDQNVNSIEQTINSEMIIALENPSQNVSDKYSVKNEESSSLDSEASIKSSARRLPQITSIKQSSKQYVIDMQNNLNKPSCSGYKRKSTNSKKKCKKVFRTRSTRFSDLSTSDYDNTDEESKVGFGKKYKKLMEDVQHYIHLSEETEKKISFNTTSGITRRGNIFDSWLKDDLILQKNKEGKQKLNSKQSIDEIKQFPGFRSLANSWNLSIETELEENQINSNNKMNVKDLSNGTEQRKSKTCSFKTEFSTGQSKNSFNTFNEKFPFASINSKVNNKLKTCTDAESKNQIESMCRSDILNSTMSIVSSENVRINSKLWKIPISLRSFDTSTIEWLAHEAMKTYYKKEEKAEDNIVLKKDDPLDLILISPSQLNELVSSIIFWNLPPLSERYVEACKNSQTDINQQIQDILVKYSETLTLKLINIIPEKNQIATLFQVLACQNNLQFLDLSGTPISNEGIQQLCITLCSLTQIRSLNLSLTNITSEAVRYLSNIFTVANKPLKNLIKLNLSYNLIDDDSIPYFLIIFQNVNLRALNLAGCNFTEKMFDCTTNQSFELNFEQLEALDISYNSLNRACIFIFISCLNFNVVKTLNFSNNNSVTESGIVKEIAKNMRHVDEIKINSLYLQRCQVNDSEIFELIGVLINAAELDTINLSYNEDLTSVTLRRMLQQRPSFTSIVLEGCPNIMYNMTPCSSLLENIWLFDNNLKSLKLSFNCDEYLKETQILQLLWEQKWKHKAKIEKKFNSFIHLSLAD